MGQVVNQATYLQFLLIKPINHVPLSHIMTSLMIQFHVFVLSDTNCNKTLFKILLSYLELTCQLMRVDKFSTVSRQGVLTGGPYLTVSTNKTLFLQYLLFSYLIEQLNKTEKSVEQGEISFYELHLETLIF